MKHTSGAHSLPMEQIHELPGPWWPALDDDNFDASLLDPG
jgi:hypothetical protein